MKKLAKIMLSASLAFSLTACSGSGNDGSAQGGGDDSGKPTEKYKIAVANIHEGESWEIAHKYMDEVVGPTLNMEFVYSEKLTDANGLINFMDQAYAAGCVGVINMVTQNDAISQGAHKAEDLGLWFITENSAYVEEVSTLPHNLGHLGASPEAVGTAYKTAFKNLLSDGQPHSAYVFSGVAVGGNKGQGAASHYYSAAGILEAFQEAYNLTYEKTIEEMVNTQDPGEVATGNPDVHIYLAPGRNPGDAATAALPVFQNGSYDILAAVFSFSAFTNMLGDVEKSTGRDIKVVGTGQIEKQTKTGFETKDSTGDTVLNAVVLNDIGLALGLKSVMMYNALNGAADAMKDNGKAVFLGVRSWACDSAETYAKMEKLNTSNDLYIVTAEELKALTVTENPNVTWKDIENKLAELSDLDALLAKKGL